MRRYLEMCYLRICIWSFGIRAKAIRHDIAAHAVDAEALARRAADLESIRDMLRGQLMAVSQ